MTETQVHNCDTVAKACGMILSKHRLYEWRRSIWDSGTDPQGSKPTFVFLVPQRSRIRLRKPETFVWHPAYEHIVIGYVDTAPYIVSPDDDYEVVVEMAQAHSVVFEWCKSHSGKVQYRVWIASNVQEPAVVDVKKNKVTSIVTCPFVEKACWYSPPAKEDTIPDATRYVAPSTPTLPRHDYGYGKSYYSSTYGSLDWYDIGSTRRSGLAKLAFDGDIGRAVKVTDEQRTLLEKQLTVLAD